jgi:cell division septal protein FtsQ
MKAKKKKTGRDWTSLKKSCLRKPGSGIAWRRIFKIRLQNTALFLAAVMGIGFIVVGVSYFTSNPLDVNLAGPSGKVCSYEFQTDGTLDEDWLRKTLDISPEQSLMDLNLLALKQQLESTSQIITAQVQRRYPDVLRVTITERTPILKIYISHPEKGKQCLLVDGDGEVFEGVKQSDGFVNELPVLFGGTLRATPDGYLPIEVVAKIKPLMDSARQSYLPLFRQWDRIRFDPYTGPDEEGGLIRVRSADAQEVIFSTEHAYMPQLQRLEYVLNHSRSQGWLPLEQIDLPGRKFATIRLSPEFGRNVGNSGPTGEQKPRLQEPTLLF